MTTKEFIEKMAKDEAIAKKMEACKSPEEAYEVAKETGLTDDIETFKTIMTAVNKRINGELSDEELENISGGTEQHPALLIAGGITTGAVVGTLALGLIAAS